jgi:thiol-disulfide isomerase/thioredoxin
MKAIKLVLAAVLASAGVASIGTLAQDTNVMHKMMPPKEMKSGNVAAGELSSLGSATEWLNSQPLTAADLRGKVVLIDVWTYTCINWLRQLPYVRAWAEKYRDQGLVVVGVHAPEFPFERNIDNVRRAVKHIGVPYPVAIDNDSWALSGDWTVKRGAAVLNKAGGRIAYRFHARDLHLVMGPSAPGTSVRSRVLIDGKPAGVAHGIDVDDQGIGIVTEQRLYQLVRQPTPIADRLFEIEFLDPGVEAFAFTFG